MDNKQLANAYAIAKVLGYEKSIDEFKEKLHDVEAAYEAQMNGKTIKSLICFNPEAK
mgnify:CR=1 FL=1